MSLFARFTRAVALVTRPGWAKTPGYLKAESYGRDYVKELWKGDNKSIFGWTVKSDNKYAQSARK